MKRIWPLLVVFVGACAHLGVGFGRAHRLDLWDEAHLALAAVNFQRADSLFTELATEYPKTDEGRESLFYLGTLLLDPRNPNWDPEPAETRLRRYLASDSSGQIHREPEAEILLQLAHQLNLPATQRISALRPETTVVTVPQRIVRYRDSQEQAAKIAELQKQLAAKDAEIAKQQEELDRIRKTLTGENQ